MADALDKFFLKGIGRNNLLTPVRRASCKKILCNTETPAYTGPVPFCHLQLTVAVAHVLTSASENDCDLYHVIGYVRVLNSPPTRFVVLPFPLYCEFVSKGAAAVLGERAIWRARSRGGKCGECPFKK